MIVQDQDDRNRDWDVFETNEKETGVIPRCGYKKLGENIITKHDKEITQRENAKRIMEFPPGIETGDGGGFDMQVQNAFIGKPKLLLSAEYSIGTKCSIKVFSLYSEEHWLTLQYSLISNMLFC